MTTRADRILGPVCAVIEGAWIDVARRSLRIEVGYRAGDLCDTNGEEHAIRFARGSI